MARRNAFQDQAGQSIVVEGVECEFEWVGDCFLGSEAEVLWQWVVSGV